MDRTRRTQEINNKTAQDVEDVRKSVGAARKALDLIEHRLSVAVASNPSYPYSTQDDAIQSAMWANGKLQELQRCLEVQLQNVRSDLAEKHRSIVW